MVIVAMIALACGRKHPVGMPVKESATPKSDITLEGLHWADSVTSTLSLRQKIAQLFMPALFASADYWTLRQVKEYADSCVGGIMLLKGDVEGAGCLIDTFADHSALGPIVAIDAEWGLSMRLAGAPWFPSAPEISPEADDQLMYDYGREVARECRALGINMVLGPVVDVAVPGSFMRKRALGGDARRVADLSLAYARGLEDGNVISVAKHFPGHGSVSEDSHKQKGVIARSFHEMDSVDLYPFRRWVAQKLTGIMVGHLAVPAIDSEMLPAAVSYTVITDLLRNDLEFRGLILTDAINMKGAEGYGSVDALRAGADIVLAPADTPREIESVLESVNIGILTEEAINAKVRNILFHKYLFGLHGKNGSVAPASARGRSEPLSIPLTDSLRRRLAADR